MSIRKSQQIAMICLLTACFFLILQNIYAKNQRAVNPQALLLSIDGPIGPAIANYIQKEIEQAQQQSVQVIIIEMDTPGGLDQPMRKIIKSILNSSIPIISYVAPSGARAASAGTYILYASHIAAMAPGTNLGAATPVSIGGMPNAPSPTDSKNKPSKTTQNDMQKKMKEDATAYIQSLAELHGRNTKWASKAVTDAASIPANEALKRGVIDIIAKDLNDLLQQTNHRKVNLRGQQHTLSTQGLLITRIETNWKTNFLKVITNPSVAYILLLIGIYGLFFEFAHPGFIIPGVAGTICLLIALYALHLLPISYVGLALIFVGIAFMVAEAFLPSIGALGIGGVIAFVIGSIMLIDTETPGYGIPISLIIVTSTVNVLFFVFLLTIVIKARRRPHVSGRSVLLDKTAKAMQDDQDRLWVKVEGEIWQCESKQQISPGQKVRIVAVEGLKVWVEPIIE